MPKEKTSAEQRLENEGGPPITDPGDDRIKAMTEEIELESVEGLYLSTENHNLRVVHEKLKIKDRPLFHVNYIADRKGVIAIKDKDGPPSEIKNGVDWGLFQELQVQSDVITTGTDYLNRHKKQGGKAQNVLNQFDEGPYKKLGDWRIDKGFKTRNPHVSVFSRSLDFDFPTALTENGRLFWIFTIDEMAKSQKADYFRNKGAIVVPAGVDGVDGKVVAETFGKEGLKVAKLTTGPRAFAILAKAGLIDRFYATIVDTEIQGDPAKFIKIPINGTTGDQTEIYGVKFKLLKPVYKHSGAIAKNGQRITQKFLVYERETTNG